MFPLLSCFLPIVSLVVSVLASHFDRHPRAVWSHGGKVDDRSLVSPPNRWTAVNELDSVPPSDSSNSSCFPALGFETPSSVPDSLDGWWCDPATEYAFLGFSYEVTACGFVLFPSMRNRSLCQLLFAQVRRHHSYSRNSQIFVIRSIRDTSAYMAPATAKGSTTTSSMRRGITLWACTLLSG